MFNKIVKMKPSNLKFLHKVKSYIKSSDKKKFQKRG